MALAPCVLASGCGRLWCPAVLCSEYAEVSVRSRPEPICADRSSLAQSVITAPRTSLHPIRRRDSCTALHALALGQVGVSPSSGLLVCKQCCLWLPPREPCRLCGYSLRSRSLALTVGAMAQAQLEDEAAALLDRQRHSLSGLWHKFSSALDATRVSDFK